MKNNNEKMFEQACKLEYLAAHVNLAQIPLGHVALHKDNGNNFAVQYFLKKELDSVQDNLTNIQEQILEISNTLTDLYNEEEGGE